MLDEMLFGNNKQLLSKSALISMRELPGADRLMFRHTSLKDERCSAIFNYDLATDRRDA